jgi:hypothetical protein
MVKRVTYTVDVAANTLAGWGRDWMGRQAARKGPHAHEWRTAIRALDDCLGRGLVGEKA